MLGIHLALSEVISDFDFRSLYSFRAQPMVRVIIQRSYSKVVPREQMKETKFTSSQLVNTNVVPANKRNGHPTTFPCPVSLAMPVTVLCLSSTVCKCLG